MPATITTLLLSVIAGLLAILVIVGLWIRAALARIESRLGQAPVRPLADAAADASRELNEPSSFETFLGEDPQRLTLPKSEQFAAYREWRKEKGMNWSSS